MTTGKKIFLGITISSFILLFIVFFTIGIIGMSSEGDGLSGWSGFGSKIAVVEVKGTIIESEFIVDQLRDYAENSSVKGILLRINSPGGVVGASQEIYDEVRRISEHEDIPIVASMGSVAASGGYYIACGADYIYANPGTITGSIGVIMQFPVVKELTDKIGIEFHTIKSGANKDIGNPYRYPVAADSLMLQALIDDTYQQFVDAVTDSREIDREEVLKLADGSIYTGRQAYELGLIDALGSYETASDYLAELAGINGDYRRVKHHEKRERSLFDLMTSLADDYLGPLKTSSGPQLMYLYK